MTKYGFILLWSDEDSGFIVTCPDFPGLSAFGETAEKALKEANIALNLLIESLRTTGTALPEPTKAADYSGQIRLRMPRSLHRSSAQRAEIEGVP
ncbi:type II toxin-antitoxin system HicB family antitoxin [Desulfuromonas sp. AOP6]|uniref:type II toxin-antitoxin system HicB family antitoxin n=1 Tax=Desulfuromonas sp. AOP6 TaxID=1566351 RepID=UPI001BD1895D|nr:type II toxin-antitoxin system HicB family antitoxin [Desulfuromonas sp. AOP6]